jgi:hypothetical protein
MWAYVRLRLVLHSFINKYKNSKPLQYFLSLLMNSFPQQLERLYQRIKTIRRELKAEPKIPEGERIPENTPDVRWYYWKMREIVEDMDDLEVATNDYEEDWSNWLYGYDLDEEEEDEEEEDSILKVKK